MAPSRLKLLLVPALAALATAGCGSSSFPGKKAPPTSTPASTSTGSSATAAGALSAEAKSAATGDIPDNQVFLVFTNKAAGYAIKYPEGWTQNGSARAVTFADKNNVVRILIGHGPSPTTASLAAQLGALKRSTPTLTFTTPQTVQLPSGAGLKATYTTESQPNPVTGKRVTLIVDRYEVASGARVAIVDLGTPRGVDNVDAYRMMIRSFRWL